MNKTELIAIAAENAGPVFGIIAKTQGNVFAFP